MGLLFATDINVGSILYNYPAQYDLLTYIVANNGGSGDLGKNMATIAQAENNVTYTWTVNIEVPADSVENTSVSFTETNYTIEGYTWSSNYFNDNGETTRQVQGGSLSATEYLYNTYTEASTDPDPVDPENPDPTDPSGDEKVSEPGMDKQVTDTDDADKIGTVKPGDTVSFSLNTNIGEDMADVINESTETEGTYEGTYNLVFHDTMTNLTLDASSLVVTLNETTLADTYYTLTTSGLTDGCTFEVSVDCVALLNADLIGYDDMGTAAVVVSYSATVNDDATDGDTVSNSAHVNNSATDTVTGTVDVEEPVTPPSTGGTGTMLYTLLGIALMGGAAVMLVVSRRKKEAE